MFTIRENNRIEHCAIGLTKKSNGVHVCNIPTDKRPGANYTTDTSTSNRSCFQEIYKVEAVGLIIPIILEKTTIIVKFGAISKINILTESA